MKKIKKLLVVSILSVASLTTSVVVAAKFSNRDSLAHADDVNNYWNHYARVEPTETVHGSKEFWANCSTHNYVLEHPGQGQDVREGVAFNTTPYFNQLDTTDPRYIPALNDRIDFKALFLETLDNITNDGLQNVPDAMKPENQAIYDSEDATYNFSNFVNVNSIYYGGFGEQWQMLIDNIEQVNFFTKIVDYGSDILTLSRGVITVFLDDYTGTTISKTFDEDTRYTSTIDYSHSILTYTIQFNSGITIPVIGEVSPTLAIYYSKENHSKAIKIAFNSDNAVYIQSTPESYMCAYRYGTSTISKKAYIQISYVDENNQYEGYISEHIQKSGEDLISSYCSFYFDDNYVTAVGNKASGIPGFKGYINELYRADLGKLLGYKVKETFKKWSILPEKTYNTLWFNLDDINNIQNVKAIPNGSADPHENNHDIYLNNSATIFTPTKNTYLGFKTSREYDVEMRKQYFYGSDNGEVEKYEVNVPMMFIQDDGTESGETNYSTFEDHILEDNGIAASVNLSNTYLSKIRADYLEYTVPFENWIEEMPTGEIIDMIIDSI